MSVLVYSDSLINTMNKYYKLRHAHSREQNIERVGATRRSTTQSLGCTILAETDKLNKPELHRFLFHFVRNRTELAAAQAAFGPSAAFVVGVLRRRVECRTGGLRVPFHAQVNSLVGNRPEAETIVQAASGVMVLDVEGDDPA